jgi:hypothetical protein
MFIFFGTRVTRKILSEGEFHCPSCQDRRPYRERRDKEWGHLYFIPLIPMQEYQPYIECRTCKARFEPEVLRFDPEVEQRFMAGFEQACLKSMVSLALMGEQGDSDAARTLIVELMKTARSGEQALDRTAIDAAFEDEERQPSDISGLIKGLKDELSDSGRETVLLNLVEVALAGDHTPNEDQIESIRRCGEWIGLSPMHVKGIVAELRERSPTPSSRT